MKEITRFREVFNTNEYPLLFRSPGRVNIIGEHTDYNEGFVLPAAIDKAVYVAIAKRTDDLVRLYAEDFKDMFECQLDEIKPIEGSWTNYVLGVVHQLKSSGFVLSGFDLLVDGDVPVGAGLSSSAAVECATAFALNELFSLEMGRFDIVKIAQQAEHRYAGVKCGIMDQFASVFGKKDSVIKLDCRSLDFEYVPLQLAGYKIVLLNTNVKHSLSSSEYNTRRQECEQGVAWVKEHYPAVNSLRDVSLEMLRQHVWPKNEVIYKRCKYVVEENNRLLEGCEDLKRGDLKALGQKMFQTHQGLSKDYEVSCRELDFLVNGVKGEYSVLGARMMGGGFGGCTINLVREDAIDKIVTEATRRYKSAMGLELTAHVVQIENGTQILKPQAHV